MRWVMMLLIGMLAGAGIAHAGILGPDGSFDTEFSGGFTWKSDCSKPWIMGSARSDNDVEQAKAYIRCVNQRAESDAKWAVEKVVEDRDDEVNDFVATWKRGY